jgi:hypothetical protein
VIVVEGVAMKHLWLLMALTPACMSAEQSAEAAANACANVTASCYCTETTRTDLRCAQCTGTPQFVEQCSAQSGAICCAADDASSCACQTGTTCPSGTGEVAVCFAGQAGGDPTPGDSDQGDGAACLNTGFCATGTNSCRCGTSCRNYTVSAYICGYACEHDGDCTSRTNPVTQQPYSRCQLGFTAGQTTYDSYCVP